LLLPAGGVALAGRMAATDDDNGFRHVPHLPGVTTSVRTLASARD
jgi:hypothetical protein